MSAGILGLGFVFQPVDLAQQRPFAQLQFGFGEVALRFLQVGGALFGIDSILRQRWSTWWERS